MDLAEKFSNRLPLLTRPTCRDALLEEHLLGAGTLHSPAGAVTSSCLPVAIGRPAEGGVASLRPWQIAIYEQ